VIVRDLDVVGVSFAPDEADAPLIVDPDAVLTRPISPKSFQTIARRHFKILERGRRIQDPQLSKTHSRHIRTEPPDRMPLEEPSGILVSKALDHAEP
jgi:hypothetical protein